MSALKKFSLSIFVVLSACQVWGQAARSPFSTFGLGDTYGNALVQTQGMAGVGVSQPQYWYLNNQNPALLVFNSFTVFQAGLLAERKTIRSTTQTEKAKGGSLNYLATAFPIKPGKWTTSLGLMPYSTVNYELNYTKDATDNAGNVRDTLLVRESGSGGLTQFYWSNGVRLSPDFAVGAKLSYVFGSIENVSANRTTDPNQAVPYLINVEEKSIVKDFTLGLGGSFSKDSLGRKQDLRISVGLVYNLKTDLHARQKNKIYRTNTTATDTMEITNLNQYSGSLLLPASFTAGISLSKSVRWSIGTELTYQDWSAYQNLRDGATNTLGKSWRAALGGEYTPDPFAIDSYFKRVTLRTGVSMEQYPFTSGTGQVKDFGINFGFSMPAGRSSLDFAFKTGKRGNKAENILEESYFKIYFGITFNDQWFIKRKFD